MAVKLTIGLPHYDDPRAKFMVQSLIMHHDLTDCEILVVDASPEKPAGIEIKKYIEGMPKYPVRYVPLPENRGPAYNKNKVFEHAKGEIVLCADCHELFFLDVIPTIFDFYEKHKDFKGLLTGPLWWGNGAVATHFDNRWRGAMWGTWGTDPRGINPDNPPFEIWGQGCGFFVCKKDAWLGFHPEVRGFGAEEGCIHEKFRKAGHSTICHPKIRWWHDFGKVGKGGFPVLLWDKIRNYVLEFQAMNMDIKPIHDHFVSLTELRGESLAKHLLDEHSAAKESVEGKTDSQLQALHRTYKLTEKEWEHMLVDPINHTMQPRRGEDIGVLFARLKADPQKNSDIHTHMDKLKEYAEKPEINVVVDVGRRSEVTTALLAAQPKKMTSYLFYNEFKVQPENLIGSANGTEYKLLRSTDYQRPDIEPCDLLTYKTPHNWHELAEDLHAWEHKVNKYMIIHDVSTHGYKLDDDTMGYGLQIRKFLLDHKHWEVSEYIPGQYGIAVLERQGAARKGKLTDPWPPGHGPGTNFKNMTSGLGLNSAPSCSCNSLMVQMDYWGVEGCKQHREEILGKIKQNYDKWSWKEKFNLISAAGKALMNGLVFKINPLSPIESMVDEAIRQAEESLEPLNLPE